MTDWLKNDLIIVDGLPRLDFIQSHGVMEADKITEETSYLLIARCHIIVLFVFPSIQGDHIIKFQDIVSGNGFIESRKLTDGREELWPDELVNFVAKLIFCSFQIDDQLQFRNNISKK